MLWVKAFHIVFVIAWFAGLFYLPRLFVNHAMCDATDRVGIERFQVMERKLYRFMTPIGVLAVVFGLWLLFGWWRSLFATQIWLHVKLVLVAALIGYHLYLGHLVKVFRDERNARGHRFYRIVNELPVLLLVAVVILVVVKPW